MDDLSHVLGSSIEYEDLQIIWLASLKECNAHPARITFSDFKKLMNGQPKNSAQNEVTAIALLPVVVEGEHHETCLPQLIDNYAVIPESGDGHVYIKKHARSRSHGDNSSFWNGDATCGNVAKDARLTMLLSGNIERKLEKTVEDRALYRKRLDMRLAVVEASKRFDKKMLDMQSCASPNAGLIMRRAKGPLGDLAETVDAHTRSRVSAAAKKTERPPPRKARRKTVSDVAGMFP